MCLRFVVADIDESSERALGVFHAVWNLRDAGKLRSYEEGHHDMVRCWFNENLERPTLFTASKASFYRKKSRALSWFKDTASLSAFARGLRGFLESPPTREHGIGARSRCLEPCRLGRNTTPHPGKSARMGRIRRRTIWIVPAGKNTYQAGLLTRLWALTLPRPVAKSHPGVAPYAG